MAEQPMKHDGGMTDDAADARHGGPANPRADSGLGAPDSTHPAGGASCAPPPPPAAGADLIDALERLAVALDEDRAQDPGADLPFVCVRRDVEALMAEVARLRADAARLAAVLPRVLWNEDDGPALWWHFPVCEPPYVGTPLDVDIPDYSTHWTRIVVPATPTPAAPGAGGA